MYEYCLLILTPNLAIILLFGILDWLEKANVDLDQKWAKYIPMVCIH